MLSRARLLYSPILACGVLASLWISLSHASADTWLEAPSAKLQTLDKITARISQLNVALNNPERFGTLEITVSRCAYRPPEEPPENAAFLLVRDVGHDSNVPPIEVFKGWVFSSTPAISGLEHAVYDVTLIACNK